MVVKGRVKGYIEGSSARFVFGFSNSVLVDSSLGSVIAGYDFSILSAESGVVFYPHEILVVLLVR